MKVLVHGLSSSVGGVETFLLNYCRAISEACHEIEFEHIVYGKLPDYIADKGLDKKSFHVVTDRASSVGKNRKDVRRLLREGSFDCVWANLCSLSDVTVLQEAVGVVPLRIAHAHNSQNMGGVATGALHRLHKGKIEWLATDYFSCSKVAAEFMFPRKIVDGGGIRIIPNSVDVQKFSYDEKARVDLRAALGWGDTPIILFVGRMHAQKNPIFALQVIQALHDKKVECRLAMLGTGSMSSAVEDYVSANGMRSYVDLLGSVSGVENYMSAADALIMPSEFEGLPMALVEAQASGLACFVSDGVSEEAVLSETVARLPLGDESIWAACIENALRERPNRSRGAKAIADAGFDVASNASKLGAWLIRRSSVAGGKL